MEDRLGEIQVLAAAVVDVGAVAGKDRAGEVQRQVRGHVLQQEAGAVVLEPVAVVVVVNGGGFGGVEGEACPVVFAPQSGDGTAEGNSRSTMLY